MNLTKYGYLFGPENWNFHATIGSYPQEHIDEILELARRYNAEESWLVDRVGIYLKQGGEAHKRVVYKEYVL